MKKRNKRNSLFNYAVILFILLGVGSLYYFKVRKPKVPYLSVVGFVNMADGLGRQSVELIDALKGSMDVGFVSTRKLHAKDFEGVPEAVVKIIKETDIKKAKESNVLVFEDALYWPNFEPYKHVGSAFWDKQIRIAYTMFESSRIPPEWTLILNLYFDAAVVPDPYLVDVYVQSGVKIPVFVLPLGLDLASFLNTPLKANNNTPFVFANFGWCGERKNQLGIVRAFSQAFGNDPNFKLILNSRSGEASYTKQLKKEISALGLTNVNFSVMSLQRDAYLDLFQKVDCYVSASKGEGFSIQPREAMALGIPAIVTQNTSQKTICDSLLVKSVESPIDESAKYPWGIAYGSWSACTEDSLAQAMIEVYNNYQSYLQKAPRAREWVMQYCYDQMRDLYVNMVKPKKIVFGDRNEITKDYLMTNSDALYHKYLEMQKN